MKHINELYKYNRQLLGEGYNKALSYISQIIGLDIIDIPSGTNVGDWIVPDEWVVKDAWVKFKGKKIIDYKWDLLENGLSLMVYSEPINKVVNLKELNNHLFYSEDNPKSIPYQFSFYDKNWGFCVPKELVLRKKPSACEGGTCVPDLKKIDPEVGKIQIEGQDYSPKYESALEEGDYEVFIDSQFKKGTLKIGVHTIKGKSDREILIFAHLDHPLQANDNLSGVQCLIDLVKQIKCEHTIKLIFCPETIGSIAYAETQDISKVDFVIAVDAVGNDNTLLIQKSFDKFSRLNYVVHLAVHELGVSYRKGDFRALIGSDEYYFNDPLVGIPGIMLSRYPYKEYHTSLDTPKIIKEDKIKETADVILKTIGIYEKDYIPVRKTKGVLMRSKYGLNTIHKYLNRDLDYIWYDIDGKKWLSEICLPLGLTFDYAYKFLSKLEENGIIIRSDNRKGRKPKITRKK
ncbi:MAG: hypothetical protein A2163_07175 [Actinobacteria bacterium RBG_13_35_12]|nr:MAG: hypothetical protein A2163_07175 [Actinobacteria bacterium RBG_13_35_12]